MKALITHFFPLILLSNVKQFASLTAKFVLNNVQNTDSLIPV
jgi:hypothetical protein